MKIKIVKTSQFNKKLIRTVNFSYIPDILEKGQTRHSWNNEYN